MLHPGRPQWFTGRFWVYSLLCLLLIGLAVPYALHGEAAATGVEAGMTVPGGTIPPPPQARVTFVHAAPFAAPPAATAVDVCNQSAEVVEGLAGIVYQQTESIVVSPGQVEWVIAEAGSACTNVLVTLPVLDLPWESHKLIVLTGDGVNYPLEVAISILEPGLASTLYFPIILFQQ